MSEETAPAEPQAEEAPAGQEEPLPREALLRLAEAPGLLLPRDPSLLIFNGEGFSFVAYGRHAWVHRVRLEPDAVAGTVERVGAMLALKELPEASWWLSELSLPTDCEQRLRELGLADDEPAELVALAALAQQGGEPAVEVRPVETLEEHLRLLELDWEVFAVPEEERAARRRDAERGFAALAADERHLAFLAFLEGEPVGFGRVVLTPAAAVLLGGGTLPQARGRGVYGALVQARSEAAAVRGVPHVVVAAGPQSAPILERRGFERLGLVRALAQRL